MNPGPVRMIVIFFAENLLYVWMCITMQLIDAPQIAVFFWVLLGVFTSKLRTAFTNRRAQLKAMGWIE